MLCGAMNECCLPLSLSLELAPAVKATKPNAPLTIARDDFMLHVSWRLHLQDGGSCTSHHMGELGVGSGIQVRPAWCTRYHTLIR